MPLCRRGSPNVAVRVLPAITAMPVVPVGLHSLKSEMLRGGRKVENEPSVILLSIVDSVRRREASSFRMAFDEPLKYCNFRVTLPPPPQKEPVLGFEDWEPISRERTNVQVCKDRVVVLLNEATELWVIKPKSSCCADWGALPMTRRRKIRRTRASPCTASIAFGNEPTARASAHLQWVGLVPSYSTQGVGWYHPLNRR